MLSSLRHASRRGLPTASASVRCNIVSPSDNNNNNNNAPATRQNEQQRRGRSSSASAASSSSSSTSVSDAEVQKFSALSDSWWDASKNPLIAMNAVRVQFIRDAVSRHLRAGAAQQQQQQQQQQQLPQQGPPPEEQRSTAAFIGYDAPAAAAADKDTYSLRSSDLPLQGLTALDIGCGGGLLSESLARLGAVTTGIDPSVALIAAAERHAATHFADTADAAADADAASRRRCRLQYKGGITVEEFAAANALQKHDSNDDTINNSDKEEQQLFDVVCCLEVIEHVPDPASVLRTACQLLQPGGLLFVSTINRTAQSFCLTIVGAEYVMRYLPIGTHQWHSYKSPAEVQQMLSAMNCNNNADNNSCMQAVETAGMVLAPSSLPALLTQNVWNWELDPNDTNVNWIACYQKKA